MDFVQKHNIPLDTIRFALGEDKGHEPRWFYIYQDRFTGEWVVAKNKSDGSTAERYRGNDEAKACQILFDKMEEEFNKRQFKSPQTTQAETKYREEIKKRKTRDRFASALHNTVVYAIVIVILAIIVRATLTDKPGSARRPGQGYYVFQRTYDDGSVWDDLYYYLDSSWYYFDEEYDDWYVDEDFDYSYDYVDDYYVGNYYSSLDGYYDGDAWDFDDTTYYQYYLDTMDNDSDNNYYYDDDDDDSWDSFDWGDWDSNDSDWDSDW